LAVYKLKLADSTKNLAACEEIIKLGPSVKRLEFLINANNTVTKTTYTNITNVKNAIDCLKREEEKLKEELINIESSERKYKVLNECILRII
jgi:hypothetical protein